MAVIGFDSNLKMYCNSTSKMSQETKDYFGKNTFSGFKTNETEHEVKEIWLLPMTPERMGIKFHKSNNDMYNST